MLPIKDLLTVYVYIWAFECESVEDTLSFGLQDGLVGLVGVLHGDGMRKLTQHPLLKRLQTLVIVSPTHKLLILHTAPTNTRENKNPESIGSL